MIWLLANRKGGVGKSCTAINIATAIASGLGEYQEFDFDEALFDKDVLLVDGNPSQGTIVKFIERRNSLIDEGEDVPSIPVIELSGNIGRQLLEQSKKYKTIIVDTGGQASAEFVSALSVADVLVSPIVPSIADIETMPEAEDLVDNSSINNEKLKKILFLNRCSTHAGDRERQDSLEVLNEILNSYTVMDSFISERKPFRESNSMGIGILEMEGADKAKLEFLKVLSEIQENLKG